MTLQLGNIIRQVDLFAKPFVFFVGEKKAKSTLIGGILSCCIIFVSLMYSYYLLNMYFDHKVQPKLTQSITIEDGRNVINVNDNFFIFEMLIAGEPLKRYEKRVGKQYLNYLVYYQQYFSNGEYTYQLFPQVECDDPQFDGFLCISSNAFEGGKDIYNEPLQNQYANYGIMIVPCDNNKFDNCATEDEINEVIFKPSNYLQLFTQIIQYNTNERQYKTSYKQEYWQFDSKLTAYTRLHLFKGTTTVTEGMLFQKSQTRDTLYDYKRIDSFFTNDDKIFDRIGFYGYACLAFEISEVHNYIFVQHAMITEILAQFMSVFNSMLLVGFFARMFAESNIVEDINNILLKEYYKQTALKLLKREEKQHSVKSESKHSLNLKDNQHNLKNHAQKDKLKQFNEKSKHNELIKLQNTISKTNFSEKKNKYFKLGFIQKMKISILSFLGKHSLINFKSDKTDDAIIYQNLIKQSIKRINIFEIYRDLIKLKMVMKLLLTKDQYAAMHFCGSDLISEQQPSSKIQIDSDSGNFNCQNKNKEIVIPKQNQELKTNSIQSPYLTQTINPSQNLLSQEIIQQIKSEINLNLDPSYNHSQTISDGQKFRNFQLKNVKSENENENSIRYLIPLSPNEFKITEQKKQSNNITNQKNILYYKNEANLKKQQQIELRDNVQNLNLKGDEIIINTSSEQSSENISNRQSNQNDHIQIKQEVQAQVKILNLQSCFDSSNRLRHLQEMDQIDEDIQSREKFLLQFLEKMSKSEENMNINISYIDKQIYSSLIFHD